MAHYRTYDLASGVKKAGAQTDNVAAELIELEGNDAAMLGEISKMGCPLDAATRSMGLATRRNNARPNGAMLLAPGALVASRRRTIGDAVLGKLGKACRCIDGTIPLPAGDLLGRLEKNVRTVVKDALQGGFVVAQFHRHRLLFQVYAETWRHRVTKLA